MVTADQLAAVSQRVEELSDLMALLAGAEQLTTVSRRADELSGRIATLAGADELAAVSKRVDELSDRIDALAVQSRTGGTPQRAHPDGQANDLQALQSIVQRLEAEATQRSVSIEAAQRAMEERLRRLEPSTASGELSSDVAAVRDNLLDIRLGQLESRIVTTLEGPYFDRLADMIRSSAAAELPQRSDVLPEGGRTES